MKNQQIFKKKGIINLIIFYINDIFIVRTKLYKNWKTQKKNRMKFQNS